MPGSAPNPRSSQCSIKQRLLARVEEIDLRIYDLDGQDLEALRMGDSGQSFELDDRIREAREQRRAAVEELAAHIREHGC
jgi:hypothetical protein